ncbi:thyroglobulin [Mantella aurantiaca]
MAQLSIITFICVISTASAIVAGYFCMVRTCVCATMAPHMSGIAAIVRMRAVNLEPELILSAKRNMNWNPNLCYHVSLQEKTPCLPEESTSRNAQSKAYTGLSFCQLRRQHILVSGYINSSSTSYIPQCKNSGEYEDVQCDRQLGECWCVDNEGMEIYGTRQIGQPAHCPQRCTIRDRRILHDVGEKVPPHCSEDGGFQPVQCKLVNTTDQMVVDLVTTFSGSPDSFKSFSSLRESFPEISGYCYCADRLGRELAGTGVELLLDEIYDTVFSTLTGSRTFTETAIYRILQRRFLGVQLITSGKFRCPSTCEIQRFTASQMGDIHVPTCDDNGDFVAVQCQAGGQCWCVDLAGQEVYGSRIMGKPPQCDLYQDCPVKRRQALSSLFFGPTGHFAQQNVFLRGEEELGTKKSLDFCPSYVVETFSDSGLQFELAQSAGFPLKSFIAEMITGLFQSKEQIQLALQFTSNPVRFQQNLFGGKYLKNLGSFNFTGAVGTKNKFSFSDFFQQVGLTGMYSGGNFKELAKLFSSEEDSYLSRDSNASKPFFDLNQPILANFGRTVNLQDNQKRVGFFSSILELKEFSVLLRDLVSMPSNVAEDVFEAVKIIMASKDCRKDEEAFVPTCTKEGRYEEVQCGQSECWCVDDKGREVPGSRTSDKKPKCPSKCEKERESQILLRKSQPAGSDLFIPACDQNGNYRTVQCAGKHCFCVDLEGRTIQGTQKLSGENIQCPSFCQLAASSAFLQASNILLSGPAELTESSQVYIPQCTLSGEWSPVQCSGPTEQTFEFYERWTTLNANISFTETLTLLLTYKESTSQSFSNFLKKLYDQGHQNVFPVLSQYVRFSNLPEDVLAGNITAVPSDNLLLNPYIFWRLLTGSLTNYPGSYGDFSSPIGHIEQRSCWCVDLEGQKLPGMEIVSKKVPKCPRTCELARMKSQQFMAEARNIITASNVTHFPLGLSFLLANGIQLSERDLMYTEEHRSGIALSERFLRKDMYAIQLAAYSTLKFFRESQFGSEESLQLSYAPYIPQCDGLGNWNPVQFYQGTGHYWCVDNEGSYLDGSLASRTYGPPQCQTSCQRAKTKALISSWLPRKSSAGNADTSEGFLPKCTEAGQYAPVQRSDADSWCVSPVSGEVIPKDANTLENINCPSLCTTLSEDNSQGEGIGLACSGNGTLARERCDLDSNVCYCLFPTSEEATGTRVPMTERSGSLCRAPVCPLPFGIQEIKHGSLFCSDLLESGRKVQKCQLVCQKGYTNLFSTSTFTCDLNSHLWVPQPPHSQPCQRVEPVGVVQTQAWFQLLLPAGKMCTEDYSGLLEAFRTFILDDLKARGLCHIQVNTFGGQGTIPICDDSTVHVECLTTIRMGVNVTWTIQIQEIPESSLPTLLDIEDALAAENAVGRLLSVIGSGSYTLALDSKLFVADKSDFLPKDSSTQVRLGCRRGFQKLLNSRSEGIGNVAGCVFKDAMWSHLQRYFAGICPAGSYSEDGECVPCPRGFYQVKSGSSQCLKCPRGTTTVYTGAYKQDHCVTRCQANTRGLRCDDKGQLLPLQRDEATEKYFCMDNGGEKLVWTETNQELGNDQCILLRKFDLVPEDRLIIENGNSGIVQSTPIKTQRKTLLECIDDCAMDESCDYVSVSGNGTGVICEQYNGEGANIICSTNNQIQTALGNSATTSMEGLRCRYKVRLTTIEEITVYRKKELINGTYRMLTPRKETDFTFLFHTGEEFPTTGHKDFKRTDFGNAVSGVYSTALFPGASLTDGYHLCRQMCEQDVCCTGFILSKIILNAGTTVCGLLRSPDVLLCNKNDWSSTSRLGGEGICRGVASNKEKKMFSFFLGGQEFTGSYSLLSQSVGMVEYSTELTKDIKEEIQELFTAFQSVFLRNDVRTVTNKTECPQRAPQNNADVTESVRDFFISVNNGEVVIKQDIVLANTEYWIYKDRYTPEQAQNWCLSRCKEEESWCRLVELRESMKKFFTCIIYPDTWNCNNFTDLVPANCDIMLNHEPQSLYRRKETVSNKVKNFYISVPYRKLEEIGVRNRITVTGESVAKGFFQCELHCDADPCCRGFGYLQRSEIHGLERICITLASLGVQSCPDDAQSSLGVTNCSSPGEGAETSPFGWYQKPGDEESVPLGLCPAADILKDSKPADNKGGFDKTSNPKPLDGTINDWNELTLLDCKLLKILNELSMESNNDSPSDNTSDLDGNLIDPYKYMPLDDWITLDSGTLTIDTSLSDYDEVKISRGVSDSLSTAQSYCLSECARVPTCVTTTINVLPTAIKCVFYPETQNCYYSLKGHRCQLLVRESAVYIFRKRAPACPLASVTIPQGTIVGKSQAVLIGSDVKTVNQFLGVPYAAPPTGENRFRPPQPYTWTGTWNATSIRSSCLQPGDGKAQYSSVSEDCLYLNVFVPYTTRPSTAILLYFHNSPSDYSDNGQTFIDGSYQAAMGDIIVVTAGYRVGVFGFLSAGKSVPNGNWGLLDQMAALKWVQENIAYFGGDPEQICVSADGAAADISSLHLLQAENRAIRRAVLMGGSAFSPMSIVSVRRAQEQVKFLAEEVGCSAADDEGILMCLGKVDAITLNAAQTKLLAVRGPFQTWGPVIDGVYLRDTPARLLQQKTSRNIDLLIGSTEHDGLISRAKAIKRFEESQGRGDSKMSFYQALQNSLGGEEMNPLVQEAAVWFYSLQHSTDDYSSFSRALENSTRDHFIACPAVGMAERWSANSKGRVFMYYVPETHSQSSSGLDLPEDVIYAFGIPFHRLYRNQFSDEERTLSLRIMQYLANFVKTGNPNFPYAHSKKRNAALPPWPEYRTQSGSRKFKEFTKRLPNGRDLKRAECSFWNDYVPALKLSTTVKSSTGSSTRIPQIASPPVVTQAGPKIDKESYN